MSIIGFEEITAKLSEDEVKVAQTFVAIFKDCVGKENAIKSSELVDRAESFPIMPIDERRVRKIINHVRIHGMISNLIASSKGYYVTKDHKEINNYRISLDQRVSAIQQVRRSFKIPPEEL